MVKFNLHTAPSARSEIRRRSGDPSRGVAPFRAAASGIEAMISAVGVDVVKSMDQMENDSDAADTKLENFQRPQRKHRAQFRLYLMY